MKKAIIFLFTLHSFSVFPQLDLHDSNQEFRCGININLATLTDRALAFETGQKVGPYFGLGLDFAYANYEQWGVKYLLEMKWTNDLFYKGIEFFRDGIGAISPRLDLSGFTWHKVGINILANDRFCIGIGGSFSDYIIDIPGWNENGDFPNSGLSWVDPSGWYWTAGPCAFFDFGIGDWAINIISSYEISYLHPKITDDYEANVFSTNDYPFPVFFYTDITINHDWGLYLSYDLLKTIDKGNLSHNVSRNDLQVGWRFSL